MIRAVFKSGMNQPLETVPDEWKDGQELIVDALVGTELSQTLQMWAAVIQAEDDDHDRFMMALAQEERESKELGRREMEKIARLFEEN